MPLYEFVELAALIAQHGPRLIESAPRLPASAIHEYWAASKSRLDSWCRSMRQLSPVPNKREAGSSFATASALTQEILASEVLTRVWTAVVTALDERRREREFEPIAHSVFLGHMEARLRALKMLVHVPGIRAQQAISLNQLRRRAERWSDLLLGQLSHCHDIAPFAVDAQRAMEFGETLRQPAPGTAGPRLWSMLGGSLRQAFSRTDARVLHLRLNNRIASSILDCFPADVFDSCGATRSIWMHRLFRTTTEAQGMIAALCELDSLVGPGRSGVMNEE